MKLLIIGANGHLGRQFLEHVYPKLSSYSEIVASTRKRDLDLESRFPGVRFVLSDLRNPSQLRQALAGIDAVVNLAGRVARGDELDFEIDNFYGIKNLMAVAKDLAVKKVIHISSVYATCLPDTPYGRSKRMAEDFVHVFESDVQTVILRPTWVVSNRSDRALSSVLGVFKFVPLVFIPRTARTNPIHATDFFRLIEHFAHVQTPHRVLMDASGERTVTLKDYLSLVLRNSGQRKLIITLPVGPFLAFLRLLNWVRPHRTGRLRLLEAQLRAQTTDRLSSPSPVQAILEKTTSLDEIQVS